MSKVDVEQRTEERVPAALRVNLAGGEGLTRDVSATGLYFETSRAYAAGSAITFAIDIDTPGGAMVLQCAGTIVRVERRGELQGIAVRIIESTLKARGPAGSASHR